MRLVDASVNGTARIVCVMVQYPSLCPSMGPQQQTHCCEPSGQEISIAARLAPISSGRQMLAVPHCQRWYGHVLRKDDDEWVKKCMEYEVEGSRPRGRPKRTWKEVV